MRYSGISDSVSPIVVKFERLVDGVRKKDSRSLLRVLDTLAWLDFLDHAHADGTDTRQSFLMS